MKRVALSIGNDAYATSALPFCVNDARYMARALTSMGFHTTCLKDLRSHTMKSSVDRFVQTVTPGSIALFYYSGHGLQFNGLNYLIPVDNENDIESAYIDRFGVNVQKLINDMSTKRPRLMIIILDACRNDEALKDMQKKSAKAVTSSRPGLAPMVAPPGTIIAYACAANEASYGKSKYGNNSVYTYHLLRYIKTPDIDIDLILRKVAAEVQRETKNGQTPFRYSSCNEVLCLVTQPKLPAQRKLDLSRSIFTLSSITHI